MRVRIISEPENKSLNSTIPDQDFYKSLFKKTTFINKEYPEIISWILTCICAEKKELFDFELSYTWNGIGLYITRDLNTNHCYATLVYPEVVDGIQHIPSRRLALATEIATNLGIIINDSMDFAQIIANYKNYNYGLYNLFIKTYNCSL